jgi:hypothetical protein
MDRAKGGLFGIIRGGVVDGWSRGGKELYFQRSRLVMLLPDVIAFFTNRFYRRSAAYQAPRLFSGDTRLTYSQTTRIRPINEIIRNNKFPHEEREVCFSLEDYETLSFPKPLINSMRPDLLNLLLIALSAPKFDIRTLRLFFLILQRTLVTREVLSATVISIYL